MKEERKQTAPSVPVIERTPPSPHNSNGTPPQFNGSAVDTGRRASEPVSTDLLDLKINTERSSSFTTAPSVQLTPPSPRRLQKPLTMVCAITFITAPSHKFIITINYVVVYHPNLYQELNTYKEPVAKPARHLVMQIMQIFQCL